MMVGKQGSGSGMHMPLSVHDWMIMTALPAASSPQGSAFRVHPIIGTTFQRSDESSLCRMPQFDGGGAVIGTSMGRLMCSWHSSTPHEHGTD